MSIRKTQFHPVEYSLEELLGKSYLDGVCAACSYLQGAAVHTFRNIAAEKVDFFPESFQQRLTDLLPNVGMACCPSLASTPRGATTSQFQAHTNTAIAPVSGWGYYRITEDGRLFLITKSEHYHASLGHHFPGYALIDRARRLGIPNATHNNTRGHVTRILEEELVRTAAGIAAGNATALDGVLSSQSQSVLNRVINLETGSIAAEAAIKLVLSRFYQTQEDSPAPRYQGRVPVLAVIGDEQGGDKANYHGTTVTAQIMRGMWPELRSGLEKQNLFLVRSVRPNNIGELEALFAEYETGPYKIAGFFLELIMMNYGARRLKEDFVRRIDELCTQHDAPCIVDEIQTCVWSPELFLFREYPLHPSIIVVGKGFPGGEYAASRILFHADLDQLPQFGALVTNGQEELASLAYLITMRWVESNAGVIRAVGDYYEERLNEFGSVHRTLVHQIEGRRHLAGLAFHDLKTGQQFVKNMNDRGLDISVQTYKQGCPPIALTKLPLIVGYEAVDLILERMEDSIRRI